jgi:hypothetical protein
LSEKLYRKIPKDVRPRKFLTNRRFIGAGGQPLEPMGVYKIPFKWTNKKGKSMTVTHEVIVMKTLNS